MIFIKIKTKYHMHNYLYLGRFYMNMYLNIIGEKNMEFSFIISWCDLFLNCVQDYNITETIFIFS